MRTSTTLYTQRVVDRPIHLDLANSFACQAQLTGRLGLAHAKLGQHWRSSREPYRNLVADGGAAAATASLTMDPVRDATRRDAARPPPAARAAAGGVLFLESSPDLVHTRSAPSNRRALRPTPSLMRTLKLSGMLHTLDARLAQARAGELGHLEFLQVLCHDEITRRDDMGMQRRLRRARFEHTTILEEFDFNAGPRLPAAQIRGLAALCSLDSGESVILHGPVGVGKTHVAQALGHQAIRHGADVRFLKTSRALADLAGGHADRTWAKRLAELVRPDLLLLEDFAMRELTAG